MQKIIFLFLVTCLGACSVGQTKQFDIISFPSPAKFVLKEQKQRLVYEQKDAATFCQVQLWPAQQGSSDPQANFKTDWNYFAGEKYNIGNPKDQQTEKQNGWDVVTGVGVAELNGVQFIVSVSTFTQNDICWCAVTQFNDEKYTTEIDKFLASIKADAKKFVQTNKTDQQNNTPAFNTGTINISKPITNFDDGWVAKALTGYVQLTKAGTEIRLHYTDKALDDAKSNMIDAPEYYWSKYVTPYYNVPSPQKWSGVEYPVIYFMQGNATDRQTGKSCFVAIKIVYSGGARPIVVIAPNQSSYQQQFPHPNDLDKMLERNKFAVTAKDITGTWKGGGGGAVEYYNVYTDAYISTHALSTSDEFNFNSNGTYNSVYRSASINGGNAQFGGQDFKGNYSVTDWQVTATNRLYGKTTSFYAQLIAVRGGYLLYMNDPGRSISYSLYKAK